ncbi:MAG TPA: zinc-binding dehydrogenase [Devosia sp.]|jgi:NADPH2:quinone reductase|uniref:quinone oxidoreductase family protein n=1 Tax=Devosia sp. TaxID=1871048 RepID=UPI002DDD32B0|nr:zinc-binding dehydrogenase [Devosia sp.]HEV2517520.1 zinc-binding dehydrogenase [Devosia sp.]
MKVVSISAFGGPEELRLGEAPTPTAGRGQVLIRVEAIGLNLGDAIIRSGRSGLQLEMPFIPGGEVAGTVAALGEGVSGLSVGDRVLGAIFAEPRLDGGYAEFVALSAEVAFKLPDVVSFDAAVALAAQGLTAEQLLARNPVVGKSILVHSAAGGVGQLLVRLARLDGAGRITGTIGGAAKRDAAMAAGADQVVVSATPDWAIDAPGPYDVIFDAAGGEITAVSLPLLAPAGRYAVYGGASGVYPSFGPTQMAGVTAAAQTIAGFSLWSLLGDPQRRGPTLTASYERLLGAVADGSLRVDIGHRFALADAAEAHRLIESRGSVGKIVLVP